MKNYFFRIKITFNIINMKKMHNLSKCKQYRIWLFNTMNHLNFINKLTIKKLYLKIGKSIKQCKRYVEEYKNKSFNIEH